MKKLLFILLFLPLLAATQPTLPKEQADSLWVVWIDPQQPDTNRLNAIHKYAWDGYLFNQPDSAFYYAQLQYGFAKAKGLKDQMAEALNTQAGSFYLRGDYAKSIDYYTKSLKIQEEIGNKQGIAASLGNIGNIHSNQGDFAKAIDYYTKGLKIQEEIGNKQGIAASLGNIGVIYFEQGDFAKAIDYYTKGLKTQEEIGNKQGIAASLGNIGNIYFVQGDFAKAIDYCTKSLKIDEETGDKQSMAASLNNIGVIYMDQGNYTKAIDYFIQSLKIDEETGNKQSMAASLNNIGVIYMDQGDSAYSAGNPTLSADKYAKAIDYYNKSLKIEEETSNKQGIAASLNNIGNIYNEQGKFLVAYEYNNKALNIAKEIGAVEQTRNTAKSLWEINKKLGRYQDAMEMYELYITSRDSILSEESQKEVIRQEFKYNYEKQAAADSVANAKANEIRDAQIAQQDAEIKAKRHQQYALYGGLFLVIVFAGFMYNRFKVTQKQKGIIEEKEKETALQKGVIEEKHKEITDSIQYAKRIQNAILPPLKLVKEYLPENFILYKPKDVVAGDFYWFETVSSSRHPVLNLLQNRVRNDDIILFAAADCTGHGVPGAMVSVICNNGLNRSVREYGLTEPGKILDKTREIIIQEFEKSEEEVKDGMDIALCCLSVPPVEGAEGGQLQYAGANNPLWIIRNGEIIETKANKQPIGQFDNPLPYTTHSFDLQKNDTIYVFSDGYVDQFGGENGKKLKAKAFRELLLSIQDKPMSEQKLLVDNAFEKWKGDLEQVDDVCIIGVRV